MNLRKDIRNDLSKIPQWKWSIFLNDAIDLISSFPIQKYPISNKFRYKEGNIQFQKNLLSVKAFTWACKTQKVRQVRAACIDAGNAASVLNFVINPLHNFELPFFGADFVTLPSGHLLALDLQPALQGDYPYNEIVSSRLMPIYQRWQALLPDGGPIPEEAKQFFSPGFLWTRLPLGDESDEIISKVIRPAFKEYFGLYLDLMKEAKIVSKERSNQILSGHKQYLNYRSAKDPARGMLTRFFGKDWTEEYINKVLFVY